MTRVAFVTMHCPHYRRPLFELLSRRLDVDFYFQSAGTERFWSRDVPPVDGDFHVVPTRRVDVLGHPVLPDLARTLSRSRYDVVVKCLNGRLNVPYVYSVARARRLPFVLWTGMWYHPRTLPHRATRPLVESIYRGADAVVVYGDHVRRFVEAVDGVSPGKVFVAGQPVEPDRFTTVEPVRDPATAEILFVGQFEERKGLDDLFAAFAGLTGDDVRLTLVGTGSLEARVRAEAARDPRITVLGHIAQDELPGVYARARCLVLPSVTTVIDREPWGLVANEAMHAGVPAVVSTAVGAAAGGLVVDGRNGAVVPERDPAALRTALQRLVSDPALASAMGDRARLDVAEHTYERMASAFEAAIDHALARAA